ncbi:MAG: amidohydrolase [Armatimonadota bacterium]|nr:amidohydrolase [Armatimonadota bacterium]MDR7426516.1 amidohydrolase [Armatimonadota bacterium]MDR7468532.1 amidohydrolase [Armatimonadota bacterium]MDR7474494.1 amidohydrolase [Armatimonadota bacterium]MDR7539817.1 amidohydrolase [Armatimonadota bacterium]
MLFADRFFRRGRIITLDPDRPEAQSLAVREGKVVAVGMDEDLSGLAGPSTEIVDLEGRTVVPGFHDAHCHVLLFGLSLIEVNVRAATCINDIVTAVASRAAQYPHGEWIRGGGYNENKLAERRHPTRHDLDPASPDHPVWLIHVSGHMGVANSRALGLAGITRHTPDPPGGVIDRGAGGEPTGVLKETAQELVKRVLPPYSLERTKEALAAAGRQMASEGLTSVQDAWAGWIAPQEFRAYQEATREGLLLQRVRLMVDVESLAVRDGRFDFAFGLHSGFGDERLRLGAVKIFIDGSLIGRTAALSDPYADTDGNCGLLVKSQERIAEQVRMAHAGGWQVAMHAIGDRAIEVGLDAIERAMGPGAGRWRPRIEHCGVLRADLIERIRRLGVVVVTQPRFIYELGDGFRSALGEDRLRLTYPLASLRGIPVALSSDRPVVDGAPLRGMCAAICRRTVSGAACVPEEAITLREALQWYTLGGAYAAFEEAHLGSLEPGKLADFVVLSHDPFAAEPDALGEIGVMATFIGGVQVFGHL